MRSEDDDIPAVALAAPILLTAMVVGLAISLFQAVTTIHEQTLTFVPKALAVVGIRVLVLPWVVLSLIEFTTAVIEKLRRWSPESVSSFEFRVGRSALRNSKRETRNPKRRRRCLICSTGCWSSCAPSR